jgi:hypothetical protein
MALTASDLQILQLELMQVFKSKATVNPELTNLPITALTVFNRQTANSTPLLEGSGKLCIGAETWYPIADSTSVPTVSVTAIASECQITGGTGVSTAKQAFALNVFLKEKISINTKDCDNALKFLPKQAFLLANRMHLMARSLNVKMINDLEANKSVATIANVPDAVTINVGLNYAITDQTYWNGIEAAKIIPVLDQLANEKGLPDNYYIMSGKALAIPVDMARDHAANDNEKSYIMTLSRRDIINDTKNLDPIITSDVIFLIDPNAIVSYFHNEYVVAQDVGDADNTVTYSIPLSVYTDYQKGGSNQQVMSYSNDGVITPIMVDIRTQKVCNIAKASNGFVSHDMKSEMIITGMIGFVPKVGDNTGIIRVDKA